MLYQRKSKIINNLWKVKLESTEKSSYLKELLGNTSIFIDFYHSSNFVYFKYSHSTSETVRQITNNIQTSLKEEIIIRVL